MKRFATVLFFIALGFSGVCTGEDAHEPSQSGDLPPPPPLPMEEANAHRHRRPPVAPPALKEISVDELLEIVPQGDVPRLKKLFEDDRETFYAETHKILEEKRKQEMREVRDLRKRYAQAKSDEERNQIRDELKMKATMVFDRMVRMSNQRISASERRVKDMERKVAESKRILQENVRRKDAIIGEMVDNILAGKVPPVKPPKPNHRHHDDDDNDVPPPPPRD